MLPVAKYVNTDNEVMKGKDDWQIWETLNTDARMLVATEYMGDRVHQAISEMGSRLIEAIREMMDAKVADKPATQPTPTGTVPPSSTSKP